MKHSIFLIVGFLCSSFLTAQIADKARYINVLSDKNIRVNMEPQNCASCSENSFIIDGNESLGYVELEFTGLRDFGQASRFQLIVNIADVEYAESNQGLSIYIEDKKVGTIQAVQRNRSFTVELLKSAIVDKNSVKIVLRGNGDDGIYISSKHSGFGAVLKLQY